jgi:hypothetical protein
MTKFGKLKFGHYYGLIFGSLFCFLLIRSCVIESNVENSKTEIIAKFVKIEKSTKTTAFYFGYYYKGKYIETCGSGINYSMFNSDKETDLIDSLKINHFYLAKFNQDHLKNIIVNPSKEIKDSTKIRNAGFD